MRFSIYKMFMVMILASMLLLGKSRWVAAQEQAPDLRMLLNLDLFGAQPSGSPANVPANPNDSGTGPSMLEQIRALNAMGFRGGAKTGQPAAAPAPAGNGSAPRNSPQNPPQNPEDDGEVPQL
jgi:hypothetical protein